MSELFTTPDFNQAYDDVPVVESNSLRMPDGKKIVLVVPTQHMDQGNVVLSKLRSKKHDVPDVSVPTVSLTLFVLEHINAAADLPVVEIQALIEGKEIKELYPVFPEKLQGFTLVEFMNDDNIDMQWRKNILRDALECATPKNHLDYNALIGRIIEVDVVTRTYTPTTGKNAGKEQSSQNIVFNKTSISPSSITVKIGNKNGEAVPISHMITRVSPVEAINFLSQYKEKKAAMQKKDNSAAENVDYSKYAEEETGENGTQQESSDSIPF